MPQRAKGIFRFSKRVQYSLYVNQPDDKKNISQYAISSHVKISELVDIGTRENFLWNSLVESLTYAEYHTCASVVRACKKTYSLLRMNLKDEGVECSNISIGLFSDPIPGTPTMGLLHLNIQNILFSM